MGLSKCWHVHFPFHVIICHLYILVSQASFNVFCPSYNWTVCVLITVEFEGPLYILNTSSLLDVWLATIFSRCGPCLFIPLQVVLQGPKFNFDKVQSVSFLYFSFKSNRTHDLIISIRRIRICISRGPASPKYLFRVEDTMLRKTYGSCPYRVR